MGDLDTSKSKVVPEIKHHTMKMYVRADVQLSTFLTMALGGEWSASCSTN
jgi:hypothetical protein